MPETGKIPDFFYYPNVCVECDGTVHDSHAQKKIHIKRRANLEALGYMVIVIRYDLGMEKQLFTNASIFGTV